MGGTVISKHRSTTNTNVALHKSSILEKRLGAEQSLIDDKAYKVDMDVELEELPINKISSDPFEEVFPPLSGISDDNVARSTTESSKINEKNRSVKLVMNSIKGLLNLTNPYLMKLEEEHPDVGTDFMALLADKATRAMCGERVYTHLSSVLFPNSKISKSSWAERAGVAENGQNILLKRQTYRISTPVGKVKKIAG